MPHITTSLRCNNRCVFCAQRGVADAAGDVVAALPNVHVFAGGEPTLADDLPSRIRDARSGSSVVCVQTNGRRLAYPTYAASLVEAGATHFDISLHGPTPAIHDHHTGVEGSFAQTVRGVRNALDRGAGVGVTTVITRSNFRHLEALAGLLAALGVQAWLLTPAIAVGGARRAWQRLLPNAAMTSESIRAGLVRARAAQIETVLHGIPLCATQGITVSQLRSAHLVQPDACAGCGAIAQCAGIPRAPVGPVTHVAPLEAAPSPRPAPPWMTGLGYTGDQST